MINYYNFSETGTSHLAKNPPVVCQDANKVIRLENGWVIAAIADGLGSAKYSDIGAQTAVDTSTQFLEENCKLIKQWNEKFLEATLLLSYYVTQKTIEKRANSDGNPLNDYDTTLSIIIYDGKRVAYGHSGDGGILTLNEFGTFKQLTTVQKGEGAHNDVYPLRSGINHWAFGFSDEDPVCSVLLATDGMYDKFCPTILTISPKLNPIYINAVRWLMDRNISPINGFKTDDDFSNYKEDLIKRINSLFPEVTDDKTVVVCINTEIFPKEKDAEYYADPDFKGLYNEQHQRLYGKKVPDKQNG